MFCTSTDSSPSPARFLANFGSSFTFETNCALRHLGWSLEIPRPSSLGGQLPTSREFDKLPLETRAESDSVDIMVVDNFVKGYQDFITGSQTAHGEETSWLADQYSTDPDVSVETMSFAGFSGFASWLNELAASGDAPKVMNLSIGMDPGTILWGKLPGIIKSYEAAYGPQSTWGTASQATFKGALQRLILESQDMYAASYSNIASELKPAMQKMVDAGTTITIAAGNAGEVKGVFDRYGLTLPDDFFDGTYAADLPPGVIVVGASTGNSAYDSAAPFTAPMNGVDVAADGIKVTINTYGELGDGTSYSAPIVAGLIGDMIAADPTLTPAEIEATLKASATPLAGQEDVVGAGIINRDEALELVASGEAHRLLILDSNGGSDTPDPSPASESPPIDPTQAIMDALKAAGMKDEDVAQYASTVVDFEIDPANDRPGWPPGGPSFLEILQKKLAENVPAGEAILWARFSGLVSDEDLNNDFFMKGLAIAGEYGYGATALDSISYAETYRFNESYL